MKEQLEKFCQLSANEFISGANRGENKTELRQMLNNNLKHKIETEKLMRWEGVALADRIMEIIKKSGHTMQ
ncbi:hypothetical protein ON011_003265 [Providencia rettgeri]|nr:hypothetical protein [Providencia rettgeri]